MGNWKTLQRGKLLPNESGLYAVYRRNLDTKEIVLSYMGESQSIEKRVRNHEIIKILFKEWDYPLRMLIKYRVVAEDGETHGHGGGKNRKELEKRLIGRLTPPHNRRKEKPAWYS